MERFALIATWLSFALTWHACVLAIETEDEQFLDGLRQRRLFHLAELFCRSQLDREGLTDVERTEWTIQRIRTSATHALHTPRGQRDPVWQQAHDTAAEFRRAFPNNPRLLLIDTQDALTTLLQGELARQESEVLADASAAREQARVVVLEATRQLHALVTRLAKDIPLRHRSPATGDELSADELISLQNNVQFQLIRAYRNQALCFDAGSSDHVAALTLALQEIAKPLSQLAADDPLVNSLRFEEAVCRRLLGDPVAAARLLRMLDATASSADELLNIRAEMVRLLLSEKKLDQALALINKGRDIQGHSSPEFDLAHVEVYLSLWQQAKATQDDTAADKWQQQALALVKLIEQSHGLYWSRRGELMLVDVASAGGSSNWGILTRTAENLFRQQEFDQAIAAYEKAADAAKLAGNSDAAFELFYKAALIDHERKLYDSASRRLRTLANDMKDHASASAAHLAAVWNLSQAVRSDATRLAEYAALCEEHLQYWPKGEPADQVRVWLARLRESENRWQEAATLYQDVELASRHATVAAAGAGRCYQHLLESHSDTESVATTAVAYFDRVVSEGIAAREAVVLGNRIRLLHLPGQHELAAQQLQAALADTTDGDDRWRSTAQSLLVIALAGQPTKADEALELVAEIGEAGSAKLMDVLRGLNAVDGPDGSSASLVVAKLRLAVIERLRIHLGDLPRDVQLDIRIQRAECLAALDRPDEARQEYRQLIDEHPDDGGIQERYAQFLLSATASSSLEEALNQWRVVAARSRPRTERWYRAKYSVALANVKLGNKIAAAKLIRYVEATSGFSTAWAEPFHELLKQCE